MSDLDRLERFLRAGPRDVGRDEAMGVPRACVEDFTGLLLAAVTDG